MEYVALGSEDFGDGTGASKTWSRRLTIYWFGNTEFLKNMSASADVLAMAKVEVDLASIPEGKNVSYRF